MEWARRSAAIRAWAARSNSISANPARSTSTAKRTRTQSTDGEGKNADCTISVSLDDFEKMVKGELDGTSAFMQGKLRVAGDMGLAMKLGPILAKARRLNKDTR